MKRKRATLLFSLLLVVGCFACQSEQDELYSQAVEDQKSAASVQPTADPNDPDYLGDPTPLPGTAYAPVPGDTLAGELRIKTYYWYAGGSNTIEFLKEICQGCFLQQKTKQLCNRGIIHYKEHTPLLFS